MPSAAGSNVELSVSTLPEFKIGNSDPDGSLLTVFTAGNTGSKGSDEEFESAKNGANGGDGPDAKVSFVGDFFQTGPIFNGASGVSIASAGGEGGLGGETTCSFPLACDGGNGGLAGDGGDISATFDGTITFGNSANTLPNEAAALVVTSQGGTGGDGGNGSGASGGVNNGGDAGFGGNAGIVQIVGGGQGGSAASITTSGQVVPGVLASSIGGAGSEGGTGAKDGGVGGLGGSGGSVCLDGDCGTASSTAGWSVATQGDKSYGFQ